MAEFSNRELHNPFARDLKQLDGGIADTSLNLTSVLYELTQLPESERARAVRPIAITLTKQHEARIEAFALDVNKGSVGMQLDEEAYGDASHEFKLAIQVRDALLEPIKHLLLQVVPDLGERNQLELDLYTEAIDYWDTMITKGSLTPFVMHQLVRRARELEERKARLEEIIAASQE